jgi:hypothetical protein
MVLGLQKCAKLNSNGGSGQSFSGYQFAMANSVRFCTLSFLKIFVR